MKISSFSLFVMLLTILSITSGCKPKHPKIGILLHSYENERWYKDKDYLVENLTRLGAQVMFEVADNDQEKQIEQAAAMIKNGVQVLIVIPINQDESARIVAVSYTHLRAHETRHDLVC